MLETIAPTVSAMYSLRAVPSTVIASASNVPSTSTPPEISKLPAVTALVTVSEPNVPTEVRLEVTTLLAKVVPLIEAAG